MTEYAGAKSALFACVSELERINPSAARSLEEGLEGYAGFADCVG